MNQLQRKFWSLVLSASVVATGCRPTQPFYFKEDGDLSHYLDVATQIEYPDVEEPSLDEVNGTLPPLTVKNTEDYEMWDLTLEEAIKITLCNSQVMRKLGGQVTSAGLSSSVETISRNILNPVATTTTYDPALVETGVGAPDGTAFSTTGVEAALSEFDARLDSSVFWEKNRRPQNRPDSGEGAMLFPPIFAQDLGNFTSGITKTSADGTTFAFRNNTNYEGNNVPSANAPGFFQALPSAWQTNFEASFNRPLLQGGGTQYNRIAGPMSFEEYSAGSPAVIDGVVIARIQTDLTLADFEGGVRDLTRDVEDAYWELYFAYRDLASRKLGRDSALETWKKTAALFRAGSAGGSADREAQSRSQYFLFRAQVEQALTDVFRAENRLRYIMGISMSDGRLIRPSDEPTTARVSFDWQAVHHEALARRVEIRKEKWQIKKRELELVAARNHMLPRLDAVGRYRWLGLGDDLIDSSRGASAFNEPGSNAFGVLTSGEFQEWQVGLQLNVPIGFRREMAQIRHHELLLARERAILQDLELEVSHQLGSSIRDVDLNHQLTQTNFNRRVAAEKEVQAVQASYEADRVTLDLLLDAQRRRAEAESAYYRSLVDYNKAIMAVHYRKGSLLDYNGVYLAEGPWPGKAYFDALREARKRDASMYLDYGFTRPNVFSRGPVQQGASGGCEPGGACDVPELSTYPEEIAPEEMAVPDVYMPETAMPPGSHQSMRFGPPLKTRFRRWDDSATSAVVWSQPCMIDEYQANYTAVATFTSASIRRRA